MLSFTTKKLICALSNTTNQAKAGHSRRARQSAHQDNGGEFTSTVLTVREQEVLRLMCRGLANKEISAQLGIALATVKVHNRHIYDKLGVKSRLKAVLCAHAHSVFYSEGTAAGRVGDALGGSENERGGI